MLYVRCHQLGHVVSCANHGKPRHVSHTRHALFPRTHGGTAKLDLVEACPYMTHYEHAVLHTVYHPAGIATADTPNPFTSWAYLTR